MRKIIAVLVFAFFISCAFAGADLESASAKELKIGYVNPAKIFYDYKKTKDTNNALVEKSKAKQAEMKKMMDEIKKLEDEKALLSEKAKAEKQAIIEEKKRAVLEFRRISQEELMKEENETVNGIQDEIKKVVSDIAKEGGYDLVLDTRTVLYNASDKDDITQDVLKRLNK